MSGARLAGKDAMVKKLTRLQKSVPREAGRALYICGERVMTRSKREFVAVAEDQGGTLRASGYVMLPETTLDGRLRVGLAYGGAASAYAIAVHEHLSEHSPPSWQTAETNGNGVTFHPEGRGPKYLEIPLMEAVNTLPQDLAALIDLSKE